MPKRTPKKSAKRRNQGVDPVAGSRKTRIHFRQGLDRSGFSSSKTSNVANADATTIVRELIQNSVDAAKSVDRKKTFIRFQIEEISSSRLPGISDINAAFKKAVISQERINNGTIPDVQQEIIKGFEKHLNNTKCSILSVSDNGVGLTQNTMEALLSDGESAKGSTGGGAHGYGHLTVLPSSGIRLAYYGGHSDTEPRIAAGHCILASFQDGNTSMNADGYLVRKLTDEFYDPFEFLAGDEIPKLIYEKLDDISNEWGKGTVVQVPFFNYFKDDKNDNEKLWGHIKKAAATNFFACIMNDEIVVEFVHKDGTERLDCGNIESALKEFATEKNSKSFIAGAKALDCFNTIKFGKEIVLKTAIGSVTARLSPGSGSGGASRIDLCRNGMWIVYSNSPGRQLPKLQVSTFEGYQRFHLVILLKAADEEIHKLVRNAEPPLHDAVVLNRLVGESRTKLSAAFKSIQEEIRKHLTKIDSNVMRMDDFLKVKREGDGKGSAMSGTGGLWKPFVRRKSPQKGPMDVRVGPGEIQGREPDRENGNTKIRNKTGGTNKRGAGKPMPFRAVAVPIGTRNYEFEITPLENLERGNLRFKIDQSMDETCSVTSRKTHLSLSNIEVDGVPVAKQACIVSVDGSVGGVVLDNLVFDRNIRVKFDFELSAHIDVADDMHVGIEAVLTPHFDKPTSQE